MLMGRQPIVRASISPEGLLNVHSIESAFKVLQTYSLVQWKQEQESYSMHKLVHAVGLCVSAASSVLPTFTYPAPPMLYGSVMNMSRVSECIEVTRTGLQGSYLRGYSRGLANWPYGVEPGVLDAYF
jgi:hypothetical protein